MGIFGFIKHSVKKAAELVVKGCSKVCTFTCKTILEISNVLSFFYFSGKIKGLKKYLDDRNLKVQSWISEKCYSNLDILEKNLQNKEKILKNRVSYFKNRHKILNERIKKFNKIRKRIIEIKALQLNRIEKEENCSQASFSKMDFPKIPLQDKTSFFKYLSCIDEVFAILTSSFYLIDVFKLLPSWSMRISRGFNFFIVLQLGKEILLSYDDFDRKEKYLLDNLHAFEEYISRVNIEIEKCDKEIINIDQNITRSINNILPGVHETKFFENAEKLISEIKSQKPRRETEEEKSKKKILIRCMDSLYKSGDISYEKMIDFLKRKGISEDELKKYS
ncbi:unnamed protein product [Blepharisma stoltei]|uniref:Uncharacterized protein n=1 Tax=Blepharisma stoltei TaxID=1481888 RepID=A0AAU9I7V3_9CILI|nr:unnamed protein product [Blepharisma stoltei]